jgi:Tfp pilus assembly protein PilO
MEADRRRRILIAAAILCVSVWVADSLVLTPMYSMWTGRAERIQEIKEELAKSTSLLDRRAELKSRWEDMKKRALPNRVSDAEKAVFEAVSRWTAESRLTVNSLKPRWTHLNKEVQTLEIELEGSGNLEAVVKFVYELECTPLPLRVTDMEIAAQDKEGGQLRLSLRFSGLVLERMAS